MHSHNRGPIRQIAYVVEDLDASIQDWIVLHGIGPWTLYRNTTMRGQCRGAETTVKMHVGLSYQNDVQIELIQPLSNTRSPYQDVSGKPLSGLHHIAWHAQDLDGEVARAQAAGLVPVFAASNGAVRVCYLESPREPGPLYELIEAVPLVLDGFAAGAQASRTWDGRTAPVSVIDFEALP